MHDADCTSDGRPACVYTIAAQSRVLRHTDQPSVDEAHDCQLGDGQGDALHCGMAMALHAWTAGVLSAHVHSCCTQLQLLSSLLDPQDTSG